MEWYIAYEGRRLSKICIKTWWDERIIYQFFDLLHSIWLLYEKKNGGEVIMVDTKRIIEFPDHDFAEFLQLICICMLVKESPDTN